jgi:circadian clock protein KaiC
LYITLSKSKDELEQVAETRGWNLDGIEIFELVPVAFPLFLTEQHRTDCYG